MLIVISYYLVHHHLLSAEGACEACREHLHSSSKSFFSALSAFSLPGILIWAGIQLKVGLYVNLDAVYLTALVVVFDSSVSLFSIL